MTKEEFMSIALPHKLMCVGFLVQHQYTVLSVHFGQMNLVRVKPDNGVDFPLPISGVKPILHPITDLIKPIKHNGELFVPIERLLEESCFDISKMTRDEINSYANPFSMPELLSLNDALLLSKWHFDIANLIKKGEAIDVNTLPENPYK